MWHAGMKKGSAVARKNCTVACIGCSKCFKVCPYEAIIMKNNLAFIDSDKCRLCRKCVPECPTNSIIEIGFPAKKVNTGSTCCQFSTQSKRRITCYKTFTKGGIHPPDKKLSAHTTHSDFAPAWLQLSFVSQHLGAPAKTVVSKGDDVKTGQLIARGDGFVSVMFMHRFQERLPKLMR